MKILVIDGQGGGLGKQLVAALSARCPQAQLTAVGTNSLAASAMRKAGADMKELKEVNRQAANIALPAVRHPAPRGKHGRLASSIRVGATQAAGVIRAGRKSVPYAGVINYGWPARRIKPRLFVNNGVASTEGAWQRVYRQFIDKTLNEVKGA